MKARHKRLAIVTSLMVSSAVATNSQSRDSSIYAEITGRADVVVGFKKDAIARGWKVVCEQSVGSSLTLRVRIPAGTSEAAIENYSGNIWDMRPYSVGI